MKKNTMMRYASVLLVAVLLTTCVISGTFAKYTTSNNNADTARVAKWGVTINFSGETFSDAYLDNVATDGAAYEVKADATVVAPGTRGNLFGAVIAGTPEVDVNVSYAATLTLTGWDTNGAEAGGEYCPIEIKVGATTYVIGTGSEANYVYATDVADLITKVQTAINGYSANYDAGTDLSSATTPAVSWAWLFEKGANEDEKAANNVKDTALANIEDDLGTPEDERPTIAISVVVTVSQTDENTADTP